MEEGECDRKATRQQKVSHVLLARRQEARLFPSTSACVWLRAAPDGSNFLAFLLTPHQGQNRPPPDTALRQGESVLVVAGGGLRPHGKVRASGAWRGSLWTLWEPSSQGCKEGCGVLGL